MLNGKKQGGTANHELGMKKEKLLFFSLFICLFIIHTAMLPGIAIDTCQFLSFDFVSKNV